jgi:arylsulfatase A-like enzyme
MTPLPLLLAVAAPPPNVVVILADDLGANDLGCYGRRDHRTPHLDRLASQGRRFTQAYAACPVCSPTRAALLTGLNPARLHLTTFLPGRADAPTQKLLHPKIAGTLPADVPTLGERFKALGYATGQVGKWHVGGDPKKRGFDFVHVGKANTPPTADEGGKGEMDLAAAAGRFIRASAGRPFLLYLCHNSPHIPLAAGEERLAANAGAFNPVYAACVETLDASVGRVLATLDETGAAANTLVVFTSDNGGLHVPEGKDDPPTHNTPFRAGKGFLYEGGVRVPLIARGPGVPAGTAADPVVSTDWTPTLLEFCGQPAAGNLDGASFAGVLRGGTRPQPPIYWHVPHYTNQGSRPGGAVRAGDWKLIEHYEDGSAELFDLAADPSEATDLAAKEPARAAKLRADLAAWRAAVSAQTMAANPAFDPARHRALYVEPDVSKLKPAATAKATGGPLAAWRQGMNAATRK